MRYIALVTEGRRLGFETHPAASWFIKTVEDLDKAVTASFCICVPGGNALLARRWTIDFGIERSL